MNLKRVICHKNSSPKKPKKTYAKGYDYKKGQTNPILQVHHFSNIRIMAEK
jgi:hypothetical protein